MRSPAVLGKAIHASTAVFDQSIIDGDEITIDESAGAAVDIIHRPNEDTAFDDDGKPDVLEKIAIALHKKYCKEISPKQAYVGVELRCERLEITDLGIALQGTTDRVRIVSALSVGHGIADLKSGKSAVSADGSVSTKGHTYQLGVYELLAEAVSGIPITEDAQIVGLNTAKTEKAQRVGTGTVAGARQVLLGSNGTPGVLETASRIVHAGVFWGNPRSMMCHENYCPIYKFCHYRR